MTHAYVDASAVLRVLLGERGARAPMGRRTPWVSSRIVEIELHRALDRARLLDVLTDAELATKSKELQDLVRRLHLIPLSDDVAGIASSPFSVSLRALDAVHVASALVFAAEVGPVHFWTHDRRQANAALSRGLEVRGV